MGDEVISRVEALLAYDFGDESAHCIALAEAAGELLALARSNSWQSIETAPKDGSFILLATVEDVHRPVVEGQWWTDHEMWSTDWEPTHWQPLPSPPDTGE